MKKATTKKTPKKTAVKARVKETNESGQNEQAMSLAADLYKYLDDKKAKDLLLLNLTNVNSYFRYFLLATASSSTHLKTLVRDIRKQYGAQLPRKGTLQPDDSESGWVVIDFIDVVVHIFLHDQRLFYRLERLWGDADHVKVSTD